MSVMLRVENRTSVQGNLLKWTQIVLYGGLILYLAKSILIPLSFALLISFVLYPVCNWLERKRVPRLGAVIVALLLLFVILSLVVALLIYQLIGFINEWPNLYGKVMSSFESLRTFLSSVAGITRERQDEFISSLSADSGKDFLSFMSETIRASVSSAIILVLIPVYSILILYYRSYWMKLLHKIFPNESIHDLNRLVTLTIQAYYNFIKGMAIVYIAVGILNSLGLLALGIPHAILFGFIASILTFVPYVGIIAGSILPIAVSWITYDSIWYPVGVIGIFSFVQYLEANVIFPLAVSNRLNVNALVMLVAIFAGGLVWGLSGMILFVPFVGIAKLIADHNPHWKTASMMLGMEDASRSKT
jgi:predicted PurR-regulated permease PerM